MIRRILERIRESRQPDPYCFLTRFMAREPVESEFSGIQECIDSRKAHLRAQGYGQPRRKDNVFPMRRVGRAS